MNKKLTVLMLLTLTLFIPRAFAEEAKKEMQCPPTSPAPSSSDLTWMKSLAGKWTGAAKHSTGTEDAAVVEYKVTSGGSAVVETLMPGTSHEMVSVYHDEGGKLEMTHYCMLGNHPTLALKSSNEKQLSFEASLQTKAGLMGQMYMNSLKLDRPSENELVQTWTAVGADNKPTDSTVMMFKRA